MLLKNDVLHTQIKVDAARLEDAIVNAAKAAVANFYGPAELDAECMKGGSKLIFGFKKLFDKRYFKKAVLKGRSVKMKKITRNDISKSFVEKAVALAIVAIFIGSAFVPAIGSQVENITNEMSSEDKEIKIGTEESINNLVSDNSKDSKGGESLWDRLTYVINRLLDIISDNPVVNRLRELFTGKDVDFNTDFMDDKSSVEDEKILIDKEESIGDLSEGVTQVDSTDVDDLSLEKISSAGSFVEQDQDNPDPLPMIGDRDAGGPWWNTSWSYHKEITVDHDKVDADLSDFPVLINITDVDLANGSKCQVDGDDIVFADGSGNKLSYEVEYFDNDTGDLVAWVNVTSLSSSSNTVLYMYYGNPGCGSQENPSGVWDSNYMMIQHLNETTGTHLDSSSYGNNGVVYTGVDQDVVGIIDGADEFDGSNGYIDCGSDDSLDVTTGDLTVEYWVKNSMTGNDHYVISKYGTAGVTPCWTSEVRNSKVNFRIRDSSSHSVTVTSNSDVNDDEWHHIVGVRAGDSLKLFFDGNLEKTASASAVGNISNDRSVLIARLINYYYGGIIDEVRLSDIARNASWISTEYNNQYSPNTFYALGNEEYVEDPILSNEIPEDRAVCVSANPTLSIDANDTQGNSVDVKFMTNESGAWSQVGSTQHGGNDTYTQTTTMFNEYYTTYWWSVNCSDSSDHWRNETYSFTTQYWWNTSWQYRKQITVNHTKVDDNLNDFPVLIDVTLDPAKVGTNGEDIVFTDNADSQLNHEIEYFDGSSGNLTAWVNVTSLSSSENTILYMYYGNTGCSSQENPGGVWGSSFVMVQHLEENSGTHSDSTSNDNDGTPYGSMNQDVTGQIDGGDVFDGINDMVDCGINDLPTSAGTVSVWCRPDGGHSGPGGPDMFLMEMGSSNSDRQLLYFNDDGHARMFVQQTTVYMAVSDASSWSDQWYYFVGTWDSSSVRLFVDGVEASTPAGSNSGISTPSSLALGAAGMSSGKWFDGGLDEIRVSTVARSSSWISTSYNNQHNPDGFYTVGSEDVVIYPQVANESPEDGATDVSLSLSDLSFRLTDFQNDSMEYWVDTVPDVGSDHDTVSDNGVYTVSVSGLEGETAYTWYVNVTDGDHDTNESFVFTTESDLPIVSNESPADGSNDVGLNPTLQADVVDLQGDSVDWFIMSNASGGWSELNNGTLGSGSGTVSATSSGMNMSDMVYYWSVNVTDAGSGKWTNDTYGFATITSLADWQYRKKIVIDHTQVESGLSDFPILINMSNDSNLSSHAQSGFDDMLFTDDSVDWDTGTAGDRLSHEIESFDSSSGNLTAWVNLPSLSSSSDTVLYMYYGNPGCDSQEKPSGVWNSNFLAVQHLSETTGIHYDSTSNDNDGSVYGDPSQDVAGWVDGCDYFDGTTDRVELPQVFSDETSFSLEAWVYPETGARYFVTQWSDSNGAFLHAYTVESNVQLYVNGECIKSDEISFDSWHHVVGTYDGSTARLYVDGVLDVSSVVGAPNWPSGNTFISDRAGGGREFIGYIDEVRLSNTARNENWIKTSYDNMYDPDGFYTIGSQQDINTPQVSDESPSDGAVNVSLSLSQLSFTLNDLQDDSMNYSVETVPDVGSDDQSGVGDGVKTVPVSGLVGETIYVWYVNVTDGTYETNKTFTFVTESDRPLISDEQPEDYSTDVHLNPTLQAYIEDLQDDSVSWSIWSNASGSWSLLDSGTLVSGHGTVATSSSNMGAYGTVYYWSVNATDAGSGEWRNNTYCFTTIDKIVVSNPVPGNRESWVSLNPELSVHVQHLHGDPVTVTFRTNASGVWQDLASVTGGNGTYTQTGQDMLKRNNTRYWWSVNATDGVGWWTNKSFCFTLVDYVGERVRNVGIGSCWKYPLVQPGAEENIFYIESYSRNYPDTYPGNPYLIGNNWAKYDLNKGWMITYEPLFGNLAGEGHCEIGFFNDTYHFLQTYHDHYWKDASSTESNFESFGEVEFPSDALQFGLGYNFTDPMPRSYSFSNDRAWMLTGETCSTNETWLIMYYEWTKEDGWSPGHMLWTTASQSATRIDQLPAMVRYNQTTWYIYYTRTNGGSYPMKYIKTVDAGTTWSAEQTCTDISTPASAVATRTSFARYGNTINIFIRAPNGDAVVYNSTDMEHWGNMQVIDNSRDYGQVGGALLHQSALFCSAANSSGFHSNVWGMILPISEMISNPGKPTDPYPIDSNELPTGTTTTFLNVTVHGAQVYDVAFYWGNGSFIGEAKLLEEGDVASIQISGLQNNTEYEWYAIARGCIDEYYGREPMTTSDENRTDVFSFKVNAQPQPAITDEQPVDGSFILNPSPLLQANITDYQGNSVTWSIWSNASDTWEELASGVLPDGNGTVSVTGTDMSEYETTYWWSVNATDPDGSGAWANETYSFSTVSDRPFISEVQPEDSSNEVALSPLLQATITDLQGDPLEWSIWSNASGSWSLLNSSTLPSGSGTVSAVSSHMDDYNTTYYWSVNVSEVASDEWVNVTYHFRTLRESGVWWNTSWQFRKQIVIDHDLVEENLTYFPVLVSLSADGDLAAHAQDDGDDLVLTDCYGDRLAHELEVFNDATGELIAWVNVTRLSASVDTVLYLYYGNATCENQENIAGVWNAEYVMVQHLNETSGTHHDSTVYGNDGTNYGSTQDATGEIDGANEFDGTDDYVDCGGSSSLQTSTFTISMWVKLDELYRQPILTEYYDVDNYDFELTTGSASTLVGIIRSGGSDQNTGYYTISANEFHYLTLSYNGPNLRLYVDGINVMSNTAMSYSPSHIGTIYIGYNPNWHGTSSRYLNGIIDEVRVSSIARSSGWIKTKYLNQFDPDSFFDVGIEEAAPAADTIPPVITNINVVFSDPKDTELVFGWENITCQVTDNTHVDQVKVNLTYPDLHTENVSMMKSGDFYYYNTTLSAVGSYCYFIWSNDTSDNRNVSGVDGFVLPPNWDINMDGVCNGLDVTPISLNWLSSGDAGWIRADINNDGSVNGLDVTFVSLHWLETWS